MSARRAFLKKEFLEIFRTYKIYVIPAIFLLVGFLSPILAKLTPELVGSMTKTAGSQVVIQIPPAVTKDAYLQLLKNFNQMVILAVIFSLIGLVADEKVRGTAVAMLTKPVPRWSFIVSKYAASSVLVLSSTLLSYLACLYYTVILFKESLFAPSFQALILVMAYFLLVLAITLFASTISRSVAVSGAASVGGFLAISVLSAFPGWPAKYSPGALASYQAKLLGATATFGEAIPALAVTLGLAAILVAGSVLIFRKQEL